MTEVKKIAWLDRQFNFGMPAGMLPFFLERIEGTISRLEKKVAGVPEEILSDKLDGKWSIKQNIGHLAEVDEIGIKRINEILQGISPMSPAILETQQDYNAQSIERVLTYFREGRMKKIKHYESLSADELLMTSIHPRLKVSMSPIDLAYFDAEHDDNHLVRINEILKALRK